MNITRTEIPAKEFRFSVKNDEGKEVARASLLIGKNDLHAQPFALLEDVYSEEEVRGKGIATMLVRHLVEYAREYGCYKIIATHRNDKQRLTTFYGKFGFECWGQELRITF